MRIGEKVREQAFLSGLASLIKDYGKPSKTEDDVYYMFTLGGTFTLRIEEDHAAVSLTQQSYNREKTILESDK